MTFAAGWNRADSELAVWSKFVPMMNGLLEYMGEQRSFRPVYYVGDQITAQEFGFASENVLLKLPSGEVSKLENDAAFRIDSPGIYSLGETEATLAKPDAIRFAVNLPPDESKTDPLSLDLLRSAGVPITPTATAIPIRSRNGGSERQLMNRELESKQQLWKWLLVAAILVLMCETALAGWKQRRPQPAV